MASPPDLKIVEDDVKTAYEGLAAIARDFREDTHVAGDIGGALGHAKLAERFSSFSESWRVNRERMAATFEALSQELHQKLDVFTDLDNKIAGTGDTNSDTGETGHNPQPRDTGGKDEAGPTPGPAPSPLLDQVAGGTAGGPGSSQNGGLPTGPATIDSTTSATGGTHTSGGLSDVTPEVRDVLGADPTSYPDVTVDDDGGGFHASTGVGVTGAAAAATLMGLYGAWLKSKAPGGSTEAAVDQLVDSRTKLLQEFEEQRLGKAGGTVDLIADPKNPSDVLAILRGEGGQTSELHFADLDGAQTGDVVGDAALADSAGVQGEAPAAQGDPVASAAVPDLADEGELTDPAATSGDAAAQPGLVGDVPPLEGLGGPTGGSSGSSAEVFDPPSLDADLMGVDSATRTGPAAASVPFAPGTVSADEASSLASDSTDARTAAGMGMMGMGMTSAASSAMGSNRHRSEDDRPPLEVREPPRDDAKKDER